MDAAEKLGNDVGLHQACRALSVSRASFYRRRRRQEEPTIERAWAPSPRALSAEQRGQVRATLNSDRFMDKAPREVYATLLDEGEYVCSVRPSVPI
jgi:putative transposase